VDHDPPDHDEHFHEEHPGVLMPGAPIPADGIGAYPLFLHAMGVMLKNLPALFAIYFPLAAISTAMLYLGAPTMARPHPAATSGATFAIPANEWIAIAGWVLFLCSIGTWSAVAVFRSAHAALTTGRALGFREAYGSAIDRVPTYIATHFLYGLMAVVGMFACFVPGFWVLVVFAPALPRSATRAVGPIQSLAEARDLVRGRYWRVAGYIGLVAITIYAILGPYLGIAFNLPHDQPWSLWVQGILNTLASTLISVTQMTAYAALHERLEETA
jgi:hypothetical protein